MGNKWASRIFLILLSAATQRTHSFTLRHGHSNLYEHVPHQFSIPKIATATTSITHHNGKINYSNYNKYTTKTTTTTTSLNESRNNVASKEIQGNETENFTADMPFFSEELEPQKMEDAMVVEVSSSASSSIQTSSINGEGLLWRGVVVILCALWASNFAAAKLVMAEPGVDSSLYAVARFGVAFLALVPGSIDAIRRGVIDWDTAKGAAICGSWVSFGYLGQTLGLLTTTASRSCVICTLHCVFVACIAEFMRVNRANESLIEKEEGTSFDFMRLIPAAVAVLGVAIVELKGAGGTPAIGDLLSFAQPIGFGMGYLQLEELVRKKPDAGLPISAIKLLMVSTFSFGMFELFPLLQHEAFTFRLPDFSPILSSPLALGGILYTGLITTALALWVESIAFKRVPATDASIILTTEPLFAALAGALTLGETFGASDYFGATLIIGACALAVLLDSEEEEVEEAVNGV